MFGLGPTELIIIAVIILLIFGAKRLPDIGKGIGGAVREFKNIKKEISSKDASGDQSSEQEDKKEKENGQPSIEAKVAGKVLEQVPAVKKAKNLKKKADKIKEIIS
jgi:sec-independent protein translocase protein TatA